MEAQNGRPSKDILPQVAIDALQSTMRGGSHSKLSSSHFLKPGSGNPSTHSVALSPLYDEPSDDTRAVLVQLFPKVQLPLAAPNKSPERLEVQRYGTSNTQIPLDEHPFFHRFAEMLPTGLAILDRDAAAVFVNKHFYDLTTHLEEDKSFIQWPHSIHPDDYHRVIDAYREAFRSQTQLRTEFRAQGTENAWRLLLLTPLGDENLRHVSLQQNGGFVCCIVDITSEKSAEISQRRAAKEAEERKEQQERFIDMISHEIRNPLSAILHCAEDILDLVRETKDEAIAASIIDAAETIMLCTTHQRHIVDDVLSFSKIDSAMLSLRPKSVQPKPSIAKSLKMFQPEVRKHNLQFEYKVDHSYHDFHVDWIMADLPRINQVVVNLISNAIKFTTRKEGEKKISVCMGASSERPTSYPPNVVFFDPDDETYHLDATKSSEWGNGEFLYIMIAIIDTGIGISDEGQKRLFERFRQATPKTEEVYGGSGLGLNISRKLCQLHGGEIGVSSKAGQGSTFGFFFKVRRSEDASNKRSASGEVQEIEELRRQISILGYDALESVDDDDMPEKLKNPEITHIAEVSPNNRTSERHERTAEIAAHVGTPLEERDDYAMEDKAGDHEKRLSGRPFTTSSETENSIAKDLQQKRLSPVKESSQTKIDLNKLQAKPDSLTPDGETHSLPEPKATLRILLVEDNIINQKILYRKLSSKGFSVVTANNGREAVDEIEIPSDQGGPHGFDCILMDQEMPVMDGNAATKAIRKLEKEGTIKHIPILGVTANVRIEQREEMIQAGMDDVIHKPYHIEEMIQKIHDMTS